METKTNVNEVREMVNSAKGEIIGVLNKLISDLPPEYLVTDCRAVILRADLMRGESRVFIDGCDITVEVAL